MNKNNVLIDMLLHHSGEYISGEEISRHLNISRTAVWKQINKLRLEGYEFEAVSRKGYRLIRQPERLDQDAVLRALGTSAFGRRIKLLDTAVSTQEEARILAEEEAPSGTVVIAEEQTAGRGRHGRRWYSPAGKGIWMSLLLRPQRQPLIFAPQLTLLTAVAVCRAIRRVTGVDAGIKWPNDLLVRGRKVCGILVESVGEDELIRYCIVGIGIDVNLEQTDISPDLADVASSLKIESGVHIDRAELIGAVLTEMEQLFKLYQVEGFAPIRLLWEALSVTIGSRITVKTASGEMKGMAMGLDPSGALVLVDDTGEPFTIFSGEVQLG